MNENKKKHGEREHLIHGSTKLYNDETGENNDLIQRSRSLSLEDTCNSKPCVTQKPSRLEWSQSYWARCIHVLWWLWLNPILKLGNKKTLTDDDLDDLPDQDKCSVLLKKLLIYDWSTSTTLSIILQAFRKDTFYVGLMFFPYLCARIAQPLFLRAIVQEINSKHDILSNLQTGIILATGFFISSVVQTIILHQVLFRSIHIGIRIRNALSSIIYRHLLSIKMSDLQQTSTAHIINLVANDVHKFEDLWVYGHFLWEGPLESLITFCILSWIIGMLPTLFAFSIVLPIAFLQLIISRRFSRYRQITMSCTDKRIGAFSEALNGCQIIKMYNWEKPMEERVRQMRADELISIKHANHLRAFNLTLSFVFPSLISFITFGGMWLIGYQLKAADIFTTIAFFIQLRMPLAYFIPLTIERLSAAVVASKRIDAFMQMKPMQSKMRESSTTINGEENKNRGTINMRDASFSWVDNNICLSSLNVNIESGQLVGIVGSVGGGKSSLLAAILHEMNLTSGDMQVNGSISYATQSPWIVTDTIRANILLEKKMDEERYTRILRACCLDVDLKAFGEVGDLIVIGEKGINLSGGQKARVSLARTLYVNADIYLFDDPLAAVDSKVAKKIFDDCIGPEGLLSKKTRLLITHQTHFLTASDQCILLSNGRIQTQDLVDKWLINHEHTVQINNDKKDQESEKISADELDLSKAVADTKSILRDEISISGHVSWSVWRRLFTATPVGWFGFLLLIALFVISEILSDASNYWLAMWSSKTYVVQQRSFSLAYIYIGLIVSTLIVAFIRADYGFYIMLRGSNCLHNNMLKSILYTTMRFFESNPTGRIINRASRDQQIVDESLPMTFLNGVQASFIVVGSIILMSLINPLLLFFVIPLIPIFFYLYRYYLRSSQQLKRLESVTRSPIYAFFSSTINGLSTIRAFKIQEEFLHSCLKHIDTNTRAYIVITGLPYWLGSRVDTIMSFFALFIALFATLMRNQMDPSYMALSLMCCFNLTMRFQWGLREFSDAQNFITSAERIDEYSRLPSEEDDGGNKRLARTSLDWPSRGSIEFRKYSMRYRPELEPVLNNIDLSINPSEKIGIIGRTV